MFDKWLAEMGQHSQPATITANKVIRGTHKTMKRFSDFAQQDTLPIDGSKIKIEEVLNREIIVIGYRVKESKYTKSNSPQCLELQFELDGDRHVLFTGSSILCEQVQKYKAEIPFATTIKKIDKYYSFS